MGIRHLQTFQQKNVPGGYYQVDILKEINSYKRFDSKPTIIIDVMSFMSIHSRDKLAMLFGAGRYSVISEMYHSIFRRIKAAGAQLVFFIDGPHQADKDVVWSERQKVKYADCCMISALMDKGIPAKTLEQTAGNRLPNVHVFLTEFKNICRQYGKMYVSFMNECDLEIVEYAHQVKALAILADDSDFLIFPGGFRYWSARNLNVQKMSTMEYDRRAIRQYLMLTDVQMKIFATFAGNDIVTYEEVQMNLETFGRPLVRFQNLADFIRRRFKGFINENDIRQISLNIFRTTTPEKMEKIRKCLKSYDISSMECKNVTDRLLNYAIDQGYTFMYQILTGSAFDLLMYFEDLR